MDRQPAQVVISWLKDKKKLELWLSRKERGEMMPNNTDEILESLSQVNIADMRMPAIVVSQYPREYPDSYVARIFEMDKPTNMILLREDLESMQEEIKRNYPGKFFSIMEKSNPELLGIWL